jgi:3-oxoadipate enol-lactonase
MTNWQTGYVLGTPRIAYDMVRHEETGNGPLLVFLHGIGGNRTNWHDQLPVFAAAGFHAVSWDARGYGLSEDYGGPLNFEDFSHDLARTITHLGGCPAHLVGLSMGGRILQDFYPRYPHLVASLTLCATVPGFDKSLSAEQRAEFVRLRTAPLLAGKSPEEMAPAVANTLIGPKAPVSAYERLLASMAALHVESYIKTVEATVAYDQQVDLAGIRVPTSLVFGSADKLTTAEAGEKMHAAIADSEYHLLPDAGHLVNIEQPEAFNRIVLAFIEKHRS